MLTPSIINAFLICIFCIFYVVREKKWRRSDRVATTGLSETGPPYGGPARYAIEIAVLNSGDPNRVSLTGVIGNRPDLSRPCRSHHMQHPNGLSTSQQEINAQ